MTKRVIIAVQDFLTVVDADFTYQIVNVDLLLRQQTPEAVVALLGQLRAEYKKELREILKENKTHPKINHLVVLNFRLKMAIKIIQKYQREEVKRHEHEIEQRAAGGSGLS